MKYESSIHVTNESRRPKLFHLEPWGEQIGIASGATFVARTHATQVNHMIQMIERAMDHQGFSVIECLSECVEFFPGAFDSSIPRKGGTFDLIQEKKWDNTPEDEARHDVTDEVAAFKLAQIPFPGVFGVFYENADRPTKNSLEKKWIDTTREKLGHPTDLQILQKTFDRSRFLRELDHLLALGTA